MRCASLAASSCPAAVWTICRRKSRPAELRKENSHRCALVRDLAVLCPPGNGDYQLSRPETLAQSRSSTPRADERFGGSDCRRYGAQGALDRQSAPGGTCDVAWPHGGRKTPLAHAGTGIVRRSGTAKVPLSRSEQWL